MNSSNAAFRRYAKQMDGMRIDSEYAFATGRVKVLEEHLLSYSKLEELARLENGLDQFDHALSEAAYPRAATAAERIKLGAAENDAILKQMTQSGPLAKGLLLQSDMHNLKAMLKYLREVTNRGKDMNSFLNAEKGAAKQEAIPPVLHDLLFYESMVPPEELWQNLIAALAGTNTAVGQVQELTEIAKEDMKHWPHDYRPAAMDMRLDQVWFEKLGELAEAHAKEPVGRYLEMYREMLADNYNLQSAARLLRMHGSVNTFMDAFVDGGQVKRDDAYEIMMKGVPGLKEAYKQTAAADLLDHLDDYVKGKNIYAFGSEISEIRLAFARFGLAAGNGIPQVAGYWLARRLEAQNLRIILAGKTNRNEEQRSLKLLRDTYRRGR